jgi:hypothetical protein
MDTNSTSKAEQPRSALLILGTQRAIPGATETGGIYNIPFWTAFLILSCLNIDDTR